MKTEEIKYGKEVGYLDKSTGYRYVEINGISYYSHRLIWFMHYGTWPKGQIDHINGIKDDNRIENLREATASENQDG